MSNKNIVPQCSFTEVVHVGADVVIPYLERVCYVYDSLCQCQCHSGSEAETTQSYNTLEGICYTLCRITFWMLHCEGKYLFWNYFMLLVYVICV